MCSLQIRKGIQRWFWRTGQTSKQCRTVDDGVEEQDREAASKAQDVRNARLIVMTDLASLAPAQPTLVFAYYP